MLQVKSTALAIPLTSRASSTLTGTYASINPNGLPHPCFLIELTSTSSTDVTISYDGVTDHEILRAGETKQINAQQNAQPNNMFCKFAQGLVVYAKGTAGTGSVYLSGYYQPAQQGNG